MIYSLLSSLHSTHVVSKVAYITINGRTSHTNSDKKIGPCAPNDTTIKHRKGLIFCDKKSVRVR